MTFGISFIERALGGTPRVQPWVSPGRGTTRALTPASVFFKAGTRPPGSRAIVGGLAALHLSQSSVRLDHLYILGNPNVALLLILTGIFLLYAEFNRPGNVVLISCGTFSAMLGIYGLIQHPITPAGVLLLFSGMVLILLELRFNTRNVLAAIATALLIVGLVALIPSPMRVNPLVASVLACLFTSVTLTLGRIALRARRNKRRPAPHLQPSPSASTE